MGVRLLVLLMFIFIYGCSKIEIYSPNNYRYDTITYNTLPKLEPTFILCQEILASSFNVKYEADLICATKKKKAKLVKKQIFNTCYLLQPISNIYECI